MIVSLVKQPDYTLPTLRAAMEKLLAPLGGMRNYVARGANVVVKLNLVCPVKNGVLPYTQAEIFQTVAEMILECGGKISAGDSPGMGSAAKVAKLAGITPIAEKLNIPLIEFTPAETPSATPQFKRLNLARELLNAEVIINLPRLKTHGQMRLTAAVKNMFGAVVGAEKFACHYRAGRDYAAFARLLYAIYQQVKPTLNIVDAIVAMHGLGPTSGEPCACGFLAASTDAVALDATLMRILNQPPESLYTIKAATTAGDTAWQNAEIVGAEIAELTPPEWHWPKNHTLEMINPRILRYLPFVTADDFRRWAAVYPVVIKNKCIKCGVCVRACAAQALTLTATTLTVDHAKCIRCYCCHELCPQHALKLKGGWFSKMLNLFSRFL